MDRVVNKMLFGIRTLLLGMQGSTFVSPILVGVIGIGMWNVGFFGWGKGPHPPMFKLPIGPAMLHHLRIFPPPAIPKPHFFSPPL